MNKKEKNYNKLEMLLIGKNDTDDFEKPFKHVYSINNIRHASYKKPMTEEHKVAIINGYALSNMSDWYEDAESELILVFYFCHIEKGDETSLLNILKSENKFSCTYWERWGLLEDGTILRPRETEKIIDLLGHKYPQFDDIPF